MKAPPWKIGRLTAGPALPKTESDIPFGLAGSAIGVITFVYPGLTTLVLVYLIAAWALLRGVFEIIAAVQLRHELENEWLLGLSGLLSMVLGVLLFVAPGAGALAALWWIGAFAILFGVLTMILGFRLKGLQDRVAHRTAKPASASHPLINSEDSPCFHSAAPTMFPCMARIRPCSNRSDRPS
jgi:hypothetical protein